MVLSWGLPPLLKNCGMEIIAAIAEESVLAVLFSLVVSILDNNTPKAMK